MKEFIKALAFVLLIIMWVNVVFFDNEEGGAEFELRTKFLASDSTRIIFAEFSNHVACEFEGKIQKTDDAVEFFKFKNAIKNNDTIYVYKRYKGLLPLINWPVIKTGGTISTDIK